MRPLSLFLLLLWLTDPLSGYAQPYDLLIRHAQVFTGEGKPLFKADVGIKGEKIKRIAPPIKVRAGKALRKNRL